MLPEGAGLGACGESGVLRTDGQRDSAGNSAGGSPSSAAPPGTCPAREGPGSCSAAAGLAKRLARQTLQQPRVGLGCPIPSCPRGFRPLPPPPQPPPRSDVPVRQSRARATTTALILALNLGAERESWVGRQKQSPPPQLEGSPRRWRLRGGCGPCPCHCVLAVPRGSGAAGAAQALTGSVPSLPCCCSSCLSRGVLAAAIYAGVGSSR